MTDKSKDTPQEITDLNKVFGEFYIHKAGENYAEKGLKVIPTGSLRLDLALGVGGLPLGRVHEIYGPESSGKTTICQHVMAEAQKLGHPIAFIDMEHALDLRYAAACGVDVAEMYLVQPDTGEQALETVDKLVHSDSYVIVVDSVAALVPKAEIEGEMGDSHMGLQARLMSQALRKISGAVSRSGSMVLFTNQLRMKIGITFGNPETTTGGKALAFYTTIRMDIRRIQTQKDDGLASGNRTRVRVVKNKVAPPLREAEFDIAFGRGIDHNGELVDIGSELGVITKRGAFYTLGEVKLGQGRSNAIQYLDEHLELAESIEVEIRNQSKEAPLPTAGSGIEEETEL